MHRDHDDGGDGESADGKRTRGQKVRMVRACDLRRSTGWGDTRARCWEDGKFLYVM